MAQVGSLLDWQAQSADWVTRQPGSAAGHLIPGVMADALELGHARRLRIQRGGVSTCGSDRHILARPCPEGNCLPEFRVPRGHIGPPWTGGAQALREPCNGPDGDAGANPTFRARSTVSRSQPATSGPWLQASVRIIENKLCTA